MLLLSAMLTREKSRCPACRPRSRSPLPFSALPAVRLPACFLLLLFVVGCWCVCVLLGVCPLWGPGLLWGRCAPGGFHPSAAGSVGLLGLPRVFVLGGRRVCPPRMHECMFWPKVSRVNFAMHKMHAWNSGFLSCPRYIYYPSGMSSICLPVSLGMSSICLPVSLF